MREHFTDKRGDKGARPSCEGGYQKRELPFGNSLLDICVLGQAQFEFQGQRDFEFYRCDKIEILLPLVFQHFKKSLYYGTYKVNSVKKDLAEN